MPGQRPRAVKPNPLMTPRIPSHHCHVDVATGLRQEPKQLGGGTMTDRRAVAAGQCRRSRSRHRRRWRGAEQEDAPVQPLHAPGPDAVRDSAPPEACFEQLRQRDHIVLPTGKPGDFALHGVHYSSREAPPAERDELRTSHVRNSSPPTGTALCDGFSA